MFGGGGGGTVSFKQKWTEKGSVSVVNLNIAFVEAGSAGKENKIDTQEKCSFRRNGQKPGQAQKHAISAAEAGQVRVTQRCIRGMMQTRRHAK